MKILMSDENPEGRKLEELLQDIMDDLNLKNAKLETIPEDQLSKEDALRISMNNGKILIMLERAKTYQEDSMNEIIRRGCKK